MWFSRVVFPAPKKPDSTVTRGFRDPPLPRVLAASGVAAAAPTAAAAATAVAALSLLAASVASPPGHFDAAREIGTADARCAASSLASSSAYVCY